LVLKFCFFCVDVNATVKLGNHEVVLQVLFFPRKEEVRMARLTLKDRKLLKKMYDLDERTIVMAAKLDCSMTAIYDELKRGYAGTDDHDRPIYDPDLAQRKVNANVRRCGGKNRRRTPT
jgi:IS30 family transposase